jgi:uncharacterized OsmC-like protein
MSDEISTPAVGETVSIQAAATALRGRFLLSAGRNHFVSDSRASSGGPGEAINAGELLLSSLGSCGLALIQKKAGELGVALTEAQADVSFRRDIADPTRYEFIRLAVTLGGVDEATAAELVLAFTSACPIYNTLKRGGPIEIGWTLPPAE